MGAGLQRAVAAAKATQLTKAQKDALQWLRDHNGTGLFDKNGVLLASGELAPVRRSTWNALREAGKVEIYRDGVRGPARVRVAA
jgi:hypothetical protein